MNRKLKLELINRAFNHIDALQYSNDPFAALNKGEAAEDIQLIEENSDYSNYNWDPQQIIRDIATGHYNRAIVNLNNFKHEVVNEQII